MMSREEYWRYESILADADLWEAPAAHKALEQQSVQWGLRRG